MLSSVWRSWPKLCIIEPLVVAWPLGFKLILFYGHGCFCLNVCLFFMYAKSPWRLEEVVRSLGTGVTDGYEPAMRVLRVKPGSPRRETAEPPLQSHETSLRYD